MPCGACSEAPREELEAPLLTDVETGPSHTTAAPPPPDGEVDEPTDADMDKCDMVFCCIVRGLLALLWLYLVDLMRRNFVADDGDYHLFDVFFVVVIAAVVGMFFCEIGVNIRVNIPSPAEYARGRISS